MIDFATALRPLAVDWAGMSSVEVFTLAADYPALSKRNLEEWW